MLGYVSFSRFRTDDGDTPISIFAGRVKLQTKLLAKSVAAVAVPLGFEAHWSGGQVANNPKQETLHLFPMHSNSAHKSGLDVDSHQPSLELILHPYSSTPDLTQGLVKLQTKRLAKSSAAVAVPWDLKHVGQESMLQTIQSKKPSISSQCIVTALASLSWM
nr:hypothetical protein Iba_chr12aCG11610 [Ipomoea batatas]